MEAKVGPSKPYNSQPSEKVIVEDIMEEDIPNVETNAKHYYVEDDDDVEHGEAVGAENTPPITDFLKLPQKQSQGTKILHEPLVDYSHSQVLMADDHIQNMQEISHKKSIVDAWGYSTTARTVGQGRRKEQQRRLQRNSGTEQKWRGLHKF